MNYKIQLSVKGQVFISAESYGIVEARRLAQLIANERNRITLIVRPHEQEVIYPIPE